MTAKQGNPGITIGDFNRVLEVLRRKHRDCPHGGNKEVTFFFHTHIGLPTTNRSVVEKRAAIEEQAARRAKEAEQQVAMERRTACRISTSTTVSTDSKVGIPFPNMDDEDSLPEILDQSDAQTIEHILPLRLARTVFSEESSDAGVYEKSPGDSMQAIRALLDFPALTPLSERDIGDAGSTTDMSDVEDMSEERVVGDTEDGSDVEEMSSVDC